MTEWTRYDYKQPSEAGVYQWRVPSKAVAGLIVTFFAHMRKRGAGYRDVLSPLFDNWDGYQVHVPEGTEWRALPDAPDIKGFEVSTVEPAGVSLDPCPYCGEIPKWNGIQRAADGGVYLNSDPHCYNSWRLECCEWASTPRFTDPRALAMHRHRALKAFR